MSILLTTFLLLGRSSRYNLHGVESKQRRQHMPMSMTETMQLAWDRKIAEVTWKEQLMPMSIIDTCFLPIFLWLAMNDQRRNKNPLKRKKYANWKRRIEKTLFATPSSSKSCLVFAPWKNRTQSKGPVSKDMISHTVSTQFARLHIGANWSGVRQIPLNIKGAMECIHRCIKYPSIVEVWCEFPSIERWTARFIK